MTRRFGRNQKRRMREELAAADAEMQRLASEAKGLRYDLRAEKGGKEQTERELREMRRMLDDIARMVGHQAIAAGVPQKLIVKHEWVERDGTFRHAIEPTMPPTLASYAGMDRTEHTFIRHDEVMNLLGVEIIATRMQRQLHAVVSLGPRRLPHYAISDSALRNLDQYSIRRLITEPLALHVAACLNDLRLKGIL